MDILPLQADCQHSTGETTHTRDLDTQIEGLHLLEIAKEAVQCQSNTGAEVPEICIRTPAPSAGGKSLS